MNFRMRGFLIQSITTTKDEWWRIFETNTDHMLAF